MKKQIASIPEIISHLQIENDRISFLNVKKQIEIDDLKKLIAFNMIVDFDAPGTLPHIIPLLVDWDTINFLMENNNQILRKFTFIELLEFHEKFIILKMFKKRPHDLCHYKILCSNLLEKF